jgi:hypothetical protein
VDLDGRLYLAIDVDGDEPRRVNIAVTDQQLADLLPGILERLRDRLKGPKP